jgi:diaminohydroxyphosphoribosylaminopyrimidine deaminase / 5-amino-6-(5-phosphoribosylamino)uracil reductase
VSVTDDDLFWMRRALAEAVRGRGSVEPNPMVGAVVVSQGKSTGIGYHERFGGPHAEVLALERAGESARGSTLYVSLEPCCHYGKTPPCTEAILRAGVSRVVVAMKDPFPRVAGGGLSRLSESGIAIEVGVAEEEARRLNGPYLKRLITGRPYVIAKWAMTLDGKTATGAGLSLWISSPRSRSFVHERRGVVDAIAVGIGTALADDPELTARPPGPRRAIRLVLDSAGRLPADGKLGQTAREIPVWVATTERAPRDRLENLQKLGCEVLSFAGSDRVPIAPLLEELGRRGLTNLLVEGGGRVAGAFFDSGEVDEVEAYIAPIVEGGDHASTPVRGRGIAEMTQALRLESPEIEVIDGDVRLVGIVPRPWRDA